MHSYKAPYITFIINVFDPMGIQHLTPPTITAAMLYSIKTAMKLKLHIKTKTLYAVNIIDCMPKLIYINTEAQLYVDIPFKFT